MGGLQRDGIHVHVYKCINITVSMETLSQNKFIYKLHFHEKVNRAFSLHISVTVAKSHGLRSRLGGGAMTK